MSLLNPTRHKFVVRRNFPLLYPEFYAYFHLNYTAGVLDYHTEGKFVETHREGTHLARRSDCDRLVRGTGRVQ